MLPEYRRSGPRPGPIIHLARELHDCFCGPRARLLDRGHSLLYGYPVPIWRIAQRYLASEMVRDMDVLFREVQTADARAAPGGIVVTCSCSGALSEAKFLAILTDAAARADKDVRTIEIGGAGADHPVSLACPQTRYLKTCVLGVGAPRVRQPGGGPSGGRRTKAEAPKQQGRRGKPRRGPRSH